MVHLVLVRAFFFQEFLRPIGGYRGGLKTQRGVCVWLVLLLLTAGCSREQKYTGPVEKVTVAGFSGDITGLVYFARETGIFEKNGLEITVNDFAGGRAAAEAMLSGKADISTSSSSVFVSKCFTNPDLRTIGTISTFEHLELIARKDKGISSVPNLKGPPFQPLYGRDFGVQARRSAR
jgi:NitT/TauT family transport system substrate-binding protein